MSRRGRALGIPHGPRPGSPERPRWGARWCGSDVVSVYYAADRARCYADVCLSLPPGPAAVELLVDEGDGWRLLERVSRP